MVTSDSTLADRVRASGAEVTGAGAFRRRLDDWPAMADPRYRVAFLDWLACAVGGAGERASQAAAALGDPVAALATAGHVLDYDDTYLPGIAHLSAPTAPAALVVGPSAAAASGRCSTRTPPGSRRWGCSRA